MLLQGFIGKNAKIRIFRSVGLHSISALAIVQWCGCTVPHWCCLWWCCMTWVSGLNSEGIMGELTYHLPVPIPAYMAWVLAIVCWHGHADPCWGHSWWCCMRWVSGLGCWPSFTNVGARILIYVCQCPCHHTWHGCWLSFTDVSARFLVIVIRGGAVWCGWADSMVNRSWGSLPFASTHATYGGMGAVSRLLSWVCHSLVASFGWWHDSGQRGWWSMRVVDCWHCRMSAVGSEHGGGGGGSGKGMVMQDVTIWWQDCKWPMLLCNLTPPTEQNA